MPLVVNGLVGETVTITRGWRLGREPMPPCRGVSSVYSWVSGRKQREWSWRGRAETRKIGHLK
eukprot:3936057-Rhodomonas_salina.1